MNLMYFSLTEINLFVGIKVSHYANVCDKRLGKIIQTGAKRVSDNNLGSYSYMFH